MSSQRGACLLLLIDEEIDTSFLVEIRVRLVKALPDVLIALGPPGASQVISRHRASISIRSSELRGR